MSSPYSFVINICNTSLEVTLEQHLKQMEIGIIYLMYRTTFKTNGVRHYIFNVSHSTPIALTPYISHLTLIVTPK